MLRFLLVCSIIFISAASNAENSETSRSPDQLSAYRVAKLFFAARAAIGERATFTDDPTSSTIDKVALVDSVKISYERLADEKLDLKGDPNVALMWQSINTVIDRAMSGAYKGRWSDHPNFPGKLIPARFGNEVTNEFNSNSKSSKVKWTTSDEFLVNPKAKADPWEQKAINSHFKSLTWQQGETFSEQITENGKPVFRYAMPEYFKTSCMNCHGGEMGKIIHKGKGAAGSGTFGGLLSVRFEK